MFTRCAIAALLPLASLTPSSLAVRACGEDGCGGSCGTCAAEKVCLGESFKDVEVDENGEPTGDDGRFGYVVNSECLPDDRCNHYAPVCTGCAADEYCASDCQCYAANASVPDLVVVNEDLLKEMFLQDVTFPSTSCSLVEGCVGGTGMRRLLRFTSTGLNQGADFSPPAPKTHPDLFAFGNCHQHYHYKSFAMYQLLDATGTTVLHNGNKSAYCMEDTRQYQYSPNHVSCDKKYDCGNQGIQRGWVDSYHYSLECSWIDITGLNLVGEYVFKVTINPDRIFHELSYDNNAGAVKVTIPSGHDLGSIVSPLLLTTKEFALTRGQSTLDAKCDDGQFCNGISHERTDSKCTPLLDPCDDGDVATTDTCDEPTQHCTHTLTSAFLTPNNFLEANLALMVAGITCKSMCERNCSFADGTAGTRACGEDGCGSSCGECSAGTGCAAGVCTAGSAEGSCVAPWNFHGDRTTPLVLSLQTGEVQTITIEGDTTGTVHVLTPACNYLTIAPEEVYSFTVAAGASIGYDIRTSGYDTVLQIMKDTCATAQEVGCADDSTPPGELGSRVSGLLSPGTYYVLVDGFSSAHFGAYTLTAKFVGGCQPLCDGNFCRSDSCGGVCGTCGGDKECGVDSRCYPAGCEPTCAGTLLSPRAIEEINSTTDAIVTTSSATVAAVTTSSATVATVTTTLALGAAALMLL